MCKSCGGNRSEPVGRDPDGFLPLLIKDPDVMSICDLGSCFLTEFYQFGTSCPGGAAGSSAGQSRLTLMDKPSAQPTGCPTPSSCLQDRTDSSAAQENIHTHPPKTERSALA